MSPEYTSLKIKGLLSVQDIKSTTDMQNRIKLFLLSRKINKDDKANFTLLTLAVSILDEFADINGIDECLLCTYREIRDKADNITADQTIN